MGPSHAVSARIFDDTNLNQVINTTPLASVDVKSTLRITMNVLKIVSRLSNAKKSIREEHAGAVLDQLQNDTKPMKPESSPQSILQAYDLNENAAMYRCIKYLNRGVYGFVILAEDLDKGIKYALKLIDLNSAKSKYAEREILNHFKLKHPHIIRLEEIFVTNNHLVLVMEYAEHGDLFSFIKDKGGLGEGVSRWFFQQLMFGVDFCHRMGIVNRDIKPENILLSSLKDGKMILKLCDFGFSKDIKNDSAPKTRLGTAMYIAPEVIKNLLDEEYDGRQADVWSCGVVLYVMLTGKYPFLPENDLQSSHKHAPSIGARQMQRLFERTLSNTFEKIPGVSEECNTLLTRMLEPEPHKRATVSDIMSCTWFKANLGKDLDTFNDRVIRKLMESPRVTSDAVIKVKALLEGTGKQSDTYNVSSV